jgi:hypothetical protein
MRKTTCAAAIVLLLLIARPPLTASEQSMSAPDGSLHTFIAWVIRLGNGIGGGLDSAGPDARQRHGSNVDVTGAPESHHGSNVDVTGAPSPVTDP